jgi:hypothetical protein
LQEVKSKIAVVAVKIKFFILSFLIVVVYSLFVCRPKIRHNVLGIGEEGAFEKRQLGFCTKAK